MESLYYAAIWYIIISLVGLITFPLTYQLFKILPDRGYSISKVAGLLLWGYLFWILASLGLLNNNQGSLLLVIVVVLGLSIWTYLKIDQKEIQQWWQANRRSVAVIEILFLISFLFMTLIRAANPEIEGTEKPMEFAFINAILSSPNIPPHDPWLSGYAISYYHFGYILVAMIAKLANIPGNYAFNLGIAMIFAMSSVGAYGIVYNLLNLRSKKSAVGSRVYALLGPLFVLLVSNWEGFLHSLHSKGLFWKTGQGGLLESGFWNWLDIKDLNIPPTEPYSWVPGNFWWWWRASRVVRDYDFNNNPLEIIDEFPFFSFLLGDLHPHVLAIPFAFLVVTLALTIFYNRTNTPEKYPGLRFTRETLTLILVSGIVVGGMAFLNTWDVLFAGGLIAGAYALAGFYQQGQPKLLSILKEFFIAGIVIGITGLLLYLPFYIGFASQAGGPLPNLIFPTRGAHIWVMFGPLLLPIWAYLYVIGRKNTSASSFLKAISIGVLVLLILWVLSLLLGLLIVNLPEVRGIEVGSFYLNFLGAPDIAQLFREAITRRMVNSGGWITLGITLVATLIIFIKHFEVRNGDPNLETEFHRRIIRRADSFVLLLILTGTLLLIGVEFIYLRDQFGWRINTIFKFYYQTWLIWGIAAAYGMAVVFKTSNHLGTILVKIVLVAAVIMGLFYPFMSLPNKTGNFNPANGWTLDGTSFLENRSPEEMEAIEWLRNAAPGVVSEAVSPTGGSYQWPPGYARVSTLSGLPGVLGWTGHESQWRGGAEEMGTRQPDLIQLFCSRNIDETMAIVEKYNIRYIFLGDLERATYKADGTTCPTGVVDIKFDNAFVLVFQNDRVKIFEVPGIENDYLHE